MKKSSRKTGGAGKAGRKRMLLEPEFISLMDLVEAKRFADVEPLARRLLGKRPGHPLAMKALSFALVGLERYEDALALLAHAIPANPRDAELHNNQGIALSMLMRWEQSLKSFERAIELTPDDPEIYKNMGTALSRMHRWGDAVPVLLKAIEKHPGDYVEAVSVLADCLSNSYRIDEAWTCYNELYAADKDNLYALCQLVTTGLKRCYWDGLHELLEVLRARTEDYRTLGFAPFSALAFPGLTSVEILRVAKKHAAGTVSRMLPIACQDPPQPRLPSADHRLRVGYLSGDLRGHPVGMIIADVIERHDRARVEVFAYSTTKGDDSAIRRRLEAAFEHFGDVKDLSIEDTVRRIRSDGIDVLVDLSGWTAEARPEALAQRCAPVQINWLGYAGTMGDKRLADYVLGDPVATPLAESDCFAERIVQLPHCYLPADTTRLPGKTPPREAEGLPEDAFVFCSLNNSYKFNPTVFDLWAGILAQALGSVLWLSRVSESAAAHLRKEAEARGISGERLIFARRVPEHDDHIARLQLADLALDPFPYNSHSTGVDTLWAGVPMIALRGRTFAGRVGASLLVAAGLPELIAETPDDYARLALELFTDRQRLADLRARLVDGRAGAPLFDMAKFARNLEEVYFELATRVATEDAAAQPAAPGAPAIPAPEPAS